MNKEFNLSEKELKELLSNLTTNQNDMAKKIIDLSYAVIELQKIIKGEKRK